MAYVIDFSDPLRTGFTVTDGAYNGPGGPATSSSLRLYGRGAIEWGESVNENQLRLNENWAGATPPPEPLEGQFWYEQTLYLLQTGTAWWRWNFNTSVWNNVTAGVAGGLSGQSSPPSSPSIGQYWYTNGTPDPGFEPNTLYRWDSQYQQQAPSWLKRSSSTSATNPNLPSPVLPVSEMRIWTNSGTWASSTTTVSQPTPPSNPVTGSLWYDTINGTLNVYNGTLWEVVNEAPFDNNYVNVSGDTMTGFLTLNANPTAPLHAATKQYVDNTAVSVTGDSMSGFLTLNANPVNPLHAATKQYVDTAVSGGTGTLAAVYTGGSPTYKAGDIFVDTLTPRIFIAVGVGTGNAPGGNWRQVFPAIYS